MMGNRALRETCERVVRETGELFPCGNDESDKEWDCSGNIDLLE